MLAGEMMREASGLRGRDSLDWMGGGRLDRGVEQQTKLGRGTARRDVQGRGEGGADVFFKTVVMGDGTVGAKKDGDGGGGRAGGEGPWVRFGALDLALLELVEEVGEMDGEREVVCGTACKCGE